MDFLERGVVFFFLLSPLQCAVTNCSNFKRLREFEEIRNLTAKLWRGFLIARRKL
jgi:hypothetical protein